MTTGPKSTTSVKTFAGKAIGGGFVLLGLVCCGAIIRPTVTAFAGEMAELVTGLFLLAMALVGHAITTWWGWHRRPHWTRWVLTQVPYVVVYVMVYVWFGVGWSVEDGGPPSLWLVPWVGLAGIGMSWLWVWWLDYGHRRNPKRAIVFLSVLGVLVIGNGGIAAVVGYRATDGLGMRGGDTPEAAVRSMTANSCLFTHDWYHRGGKPVAADCPDGSREPADKLGQYLADDQPRHAMDRWYRHHQAFQALPRLRYDGPVIESADGLVMARLRVELPVQAEGQDLRSLGPDERWCLPDGRQETWVIRLESGLVGGWRISRLEIHTPVTVVPFRGSACDVGEISRS